MKNIILVATVAVLTQTAQCAFVKTAAMPATAARGLSVYSLTLPLEVGNYDVEFEFGDENLATENWVKFEGRRIALDRVATGKGEKKSIAFTARVKGPIAKDDAPTGEAPFPYALNLTLVTSAPKAAEPKITRNDNAATIYLCGDSTVTDQQGEPWGSWGQALPAFFDKGVAVANFARSGLTTHSFLQQKRLDRILAHLGPRDVVLVQFGHNDQKAPWLRPFEGYKDKLRFYIDSVQSKGAKIVIISPMERLRFDRRTHKQEGKTLADYAQAAEETAKEKGVPFIDLNNASYTLYGTMGEKKAPELFCTYSIEDQIRDFYGEKGKDGGGIRNLADKTHHSIYGAYTLANYIADCLCEKLPELASFRREGIAKLDVKSIPVNPNIPPTGVVDTTRPEGDVGNKE